MRNQYLEGGGKVEGVIRKPGWNQTKGNTASKAIRPSATRPGRYGMPARLEKSSQEASSLEENSSDNLHRVQLEAAQTET